MNIDRMDYEALTLIMEKRIATHVKMVRKKRSLREANERRFFVTAANEALFVWMLLASRMNSDLYPADKARLTRMIQDFATECPKVDEVWFNEEIPPPDGTM